MRQELGVRLLDLSLRRIEGLVLARHTGAAQSAAAHAPR